jgi:FkbM family methyltransferase
MLARIKRSLSRPDIRRAPLKGLLKRAWWKLRWIVSKRDWCLTLPGGMKLYTPQTGPSALIYYQGCSDVDVEQTLAQVLKPGQVMFDVGAHVGEFSMSGVRYVGPNGAVHAFEPQPVLAAVITKNANLNGLDNLYVTAACVSDQDGSVELKLGSDPALASIVWNDRLPTAQQLLHVPALRLDTYWDQRGQPQVALIKIDVEGAELLVLRGAEEMLSLPAGLAPAVLLECSRHYEGYGYTVRDIMIWLNDHGYNIFQSAGETGWQPVPLNDVTGAKTRNLLALKIAPQP